MSNKTIATRICDVCGDHAPGVQFHHNDEPFLFACVRCEYQSFESQARLDIDEWLEGGNFHGM